MAQPMALRMAMPVIHTVGEECDDAFAEDPEKRGKRGVGDEDGDWNRKEVREVRERHHGAEFRLFLRKVNGL